MLCVSNRRSGISRLKRFAIVLFCLILASGMLLPGAARAEESGQKTVRVGWHEPPYYITDQYGRRSGYSYEYGWKLGAYTGWNYEYVEGNWSDLLQMLKDGEIDLMANISYTAERAEQILYPTLPMGTESYYIFTAPGNEEISADDLSTLNGKRVGVTKDSIQKDLFLVWEETHNIHTQIRELSGTEEDTIALLNAGELDAVVTIDTYGNSEDTVPICKIGSSDFYFAVSKDRPDLLAELNAGMSRIQDENKYYNQQLYEKYLGGSDTDLYLSTQEKEWLLEHGAIRVGYQDNYMAFCAADENGGLTGALKDYLEFASTALENANLEFKAFVYPTASAAIEALKNGEIDCMFPANLNDFDSEELGVVMTPALMRTEMDAVVRAADQKEFIRKEDAIVAINEGNPNYEMFLADNFPGWQRAYFPDTPTGLKAVAAGDADCVIISNYRFNNIAKQCEQLHLATIYTGVDMDYYFAVCKGETELYSILAKANAAVPDSVVHTALTYYSTEDIKTSFGDIIRDNLFLVMMVIAVILLIILILLLRSIKAEKKVLEEEHLVDDLNRRVFVDALTHVRNKGGFDNYMQELQDKVEQDEQVRFAVGVFDCDDLKMINDQNGHDKGNLYLQAASRLICRVFQHSPVFRIGGDEFVVVLQNEDFENREELVTKFNSSKEEISASAENKWDEVHISMGIAEYDPAIDSSVHDTVRRADKAMYENKQKTKAKEDPHG